MNAFLTGVRDFFGPPRLLPATPPIEPVVALAPTPTIAPKPDRANPAKRKPVKPAKKAARRSR
jgi:hypothetical protein